LLKLSGFEAACGIKVQLDGNNILPPGGVETMTLKTFADGRVGPDAAAFVLTKTVGSFSKQESYEIDYNVIPSPYLSSAECHTKRGGVCDVKVPFSSMTEPIEIISAPNGVIAEGSIQSVHIRLDDGAPEGAVGEVKLKVTDENGKVATFALPVFTDVAQDALRTYPSSVVASKDGNQMTASFKIVNARDVSHIAVSCPDPNVSVIRNSDHVVVSSRLGRASGLVHITVAEPSGRQVGADVLF
jgi:hypothetical protein